MDIVLQVAVLDSINHLPLVPNVQYRIVLIVLINLIAERVKLGIILQNRRHAMI